jgi:fructose-1,6-bisphosphatase class II
MSLDKFIFDFLNATEKAAIASSNLCGLGDKHGADKAAVNAMRDSIDKIDAKITVVIGEGERDNAPMLYIGEVLGEGEIHLDLAVDPLEGTDICASLGSGALSVVGFGIKSTILNAPDVYMEKLFTRYNCQIDLNNNIEKNLQLIADEKNCDLKDLKVVILARDRHKKLIQDIRNAGARIKLINDGDIAAILSIIIKEDADLYVGIGGAPEGVLAAIAVKNLGGNLQTKLVFQSEDEITRARKLGISNLNTIYTADDLVKGDSILIATGVTDGEFLNGVKYTENNKLTLESLIINRAGYSKITSVKKY